VIAVNRERMKAGDIARVDLSRVELQRVQFESDLVNARVNLRTAKIALLALVNDRTPVDQFDVTGQYDDRVIVPALDELRAQSLALRPDLQSAVTAIDRAKNDNKLAWANGSTDPTLALDYTRAGPFNTIGLGFSIPLRVFDRNQGEKERTRLEIERSQSMRTSIEVSIYRDVDSAYATVESARALLQPYRDRYLKQAEEVRDTVSFSYGRGAASLLEFLDAQKAYRDTQLNYRNLIAGFLSAVNQLNLAVGKDVTK
jgi:cobalt-zinc-cadmium efflux system outer membrane protein